MTEEKRILKIKKILVLDGTGFLGYYTTEELLSQGYEKDDVYAAIEETL